MASAPHMQNHVHPYVSGWCEGTAHERCKGRYAGADCSCACHRQPASTLLLLEHADVTAGEPAVTDQA